MRHRIRQRARLAAGPFSVSALLAFALFPALANAEDSSGIQYSDAPPTVTGKQVPNSSATNAGGAAGQSSTRSGSTDGRKSDDSRENGSAGGAAGHRGGDGKDGGSGASGANQRGEEGTPAEAIDLAPSSTDEGSSPLVPILIALAVLAAISIGTVAMRRRRQGPADGETPVSPEAS
jgi:cobalamin biosynthesis Mg chelatase CobN